MKPGTCLSHRLPPPTRGPDPLSGSPFLPSNTSPHLLQVEDHSDVVPDESVYQVELMDVLLLPQVWRM